jgi:hypothetical protein
VLLWSPHTDSPSVWVRIFYRKLQATIPDDVANSLISFSPCRSCILKVSNAPIPASVEVVSADDSLSVERKHVKKGTHSTPWMFAISFTVATEIGVKVQGS